MLALRYASKTLRVTSRPSLLRLYASAPNQRFVVPSHNLIKEQTEYRQLPDDSQYIEKFYSELSSFHSEIVKNTKIPYTSFSEFENDPNSLITELENFIQTKVYPEYVNKDDLGSQMVIKRYNDFLRNVKITLILNGGHTFIFDILLQNKKLFDGFDHNKK
ncbi:CYFA0S10e02674g1_1 [Cyberlindnera fabianii]|uniref:CYFA0S10e02674g1_1 n=1 Tax=Cyberlindnera fabianii TaxID=36022 RepID=A0A061AYS2_CYBFA|nr:CYFA0S10e02674g1_1 [Cyberlindnera fabianii]